MTERAEYRQRIAAELKEVDETLGRLRAELRSRTADVEDFAEAGSDLTNYAEEQALIDSLKARRQRLLEQLDAD